MAKLSDLSLDDSGPSPLDELALTRRTADRVVAELEDMLDTDQYSFCWGMLQDMKLTITQRGRVTAAQREAIHNVKVGSQRHEDQRARWDNRDQGRRYEGWDDRRDC